MPVTFGAMSQGNTRTPPRLPALLAARLPFFYGWVVLGVLCFAGFARQGPAVATLSVFVTPLIHDFGWSRTALSGAVSLGGILGGEIMRLGSVIGPWLDRVGSRLLLCLAVLTTGAAMLLLSLTQSLAMFYLLFCFARMNWASPFELGIYGAVNNWFVRRRGFATSVATLAQMAGLVAMPLIAQLAMQRSSWRAGWLAIGTLTLVVGFLPTLLLLARRPEDVGLHPDGLASDPLADNATSPAAAPAPEPRFSRAQALRTPAFWLLLLYTVVVYPVQAGISLHQAPHSGSSAASPPAIAATIVSTFSLMSAAASSHSRAPAATLADPLSDGGDRRLLPGQPPIDENHRLAGRCLPCRRVVRVRGRRHPDLAAGRLGGLFRPRQFRRDPRRRAVGAGRGAGASGCHSPAVCATGPATTSCR